MVSGIGLGKMSKRRASTLTKVLDSPPVEHVEIDDADRLDASDMDNYSVMSSFGASSHSLQGHGHFSSVKKVDHLEGGNNLEVLSLEQQVSPREVPPKDSPPSGGGLMRSLSRRFSTSPGKASGPESPPSPSSGFLRSFSRRFSLRGASLGGDDDDEKPKRMLLPTNREEVEIDTEKASLGAISEKKTTLLPKGSQPTPSFKSEKGAGIRKTTWKTMRGMVAFDGRAHLERTLRETVTDPDLNVVVKLAHTLIDSRHHSSAAAYSGALLMEWAAFRGFQLTTAEQRVLARAHAEVWLSRGIAGENYNLERAKSHYEACINA